MKKHLILSSILCLSMILIPFLAKPICSDNIQNSTESLRNKSKITTASDYMQVMRTETGIPFTAEVTESE